MKSRKKTCPVCRSGLTVSSASPGDGRTRYQCSNTGCGHTFTEGKPPGKGRRDWPTFRPKSR